MRIAQDWNDYAVLDASGGEKLERWGDTILIRPDPQIIWKTPKLDPNWKKASARYHRSSSGGGQWENHKPMKESWTVSYKGLTFKIKPTGFKHTGLFPEQAVNWDFLNEQILKNKGPVNVLNLFAYTGGATLACLQAGASVCHVDASKGMVSWARENAALSHLADKPVRWIVEDCFKFAGREIRRGSRYQGIVMDPPSYGRGPNGEVWKLEEQIYDFVDLASNLLADDALFLILNSYTTGLSPSVMSYILQSVIVKKRGGSVWADEIGLPVKASGQALPCGSTAIWMQNGI